MNFITLKLLTIVVDEALGGIIEKEISNLGAKGYTITHVEGKGSTGERDNPWVGENLKIETLVSEDVCNKIIKFISVKYLNKYPLIVFFSEVSVIRPSHFL